MAAPDFYVVLTDSTGRAVFTFAGTEVPEVITWGGEQKLAVHELIGGGRVVEAIGQQPGALSWSGWLLGSQAQQRAQNLDTLRQQGNPLTLTWGGRRYLVVLRQFAADFQRYYKMYYHLSFEVVQDLNAPVVGTQPDLDALINYDLNIALVLVAGQGNSALSGQASSLSSAIHAISSFAGATKSMIASVLAPLQVLRATTKQLIATANNTILSVTTLGGVLPHNPVAQNATALLNHVNTVNSSVQLVQLDNTLGRLGQNVGNAGGASAQTVTVSTGSLYDQAVQQYGDATQWTTIANANGLTDPQIQGTQTLVIPPTPQNTGGVLNA